MLFNSINFFVFFIVVTGLYFTIPHKFRWGLLLLASCYFYMSFIPIYILILALTIGVDYIAALQIEKTSGKKRKLYLVISIISTCAILFVFKYFNFFNSNFESLAHVLHWNYPIGALKLILPLGLSFHTFQSLSYVIEVYRGNQKAERNFGIYSLYVMFYPQLVAGPIERPQNMLHQFYEKHDFDYERVKSGLFLMLWGLFKKMVLADRLALYVNEVFNNPGKYHGMSVIVAIIFFAFQIYFDFSGYSDIAIGCARVMGFRLMTNFSFPFSSKSISEFWRRWHISLSSWLNDYLYTPITISKRGWGKYAIIYAVLVTYFMSGVWHGAGWTFIIFGTLHGIAVTYEILTRKLRKKISKVVPKRFYDIFSILTTFAFACFAWVFFRARTVQEAFGIIKAIFKLNSFSSIFGVLLSPFEILLFILLSAIVFYTEYKGTKYGSIDRAVLSHPKLFRWLTYMSLIVGIAILGNFDKIDFIYFQF